MYTCGTQQYLVYIYIYIILDIDKMIYQEEFRVIFVSTLEAEFEFRIILKNQQTVEKIFFFLLCSKVSASGSGGEKIALFPKVDTLIIQSNMDDK